MHRRRRHRGLALLTLFTAGVFFLSRASADVRGSPELSLYYTHNNTFRSRLAANTTWSQDKSDFSAAAVEYDLDIGLLSFFRRYVFKDPNAEKSKRVSIRLGYAHFFDLTSGNSKLDEKRGLAELTLRAPLGKAWLLSDRNRGELRQQNEKEFGRYRNRLRIERNVAVSRFRITPYIHSEIYYDGRTNEWNQVDGTFGAEIPWRHQTILEFYFTQQFTDKETDNQLIGLTLQKHL